MFCPKCNSLLYPEAGKMVCRREGCGYIGEPIDETQESVKSRKKEKPEILVLDSITETLPTTKIECPSCGHNEAMYMIRQTRASDEPMTRIYRCTRCRHTWREF